MLLGLNAYTFWADVNPWQSLNSTRLSLYSETAAHMTPVCVFCRAQVKLLLCLLL